MVGLKGAVLLGGAALAILLVSNIYSYNKGLSNGYGNAVAEVNRANNAAQQAAERARAELAERCQRDPVVCLSDKWTRDRPN